MRRPSPTKKHWIPPESGCICVNCDAAVIENAAGVGLGFIWRKADGQIISAGMIYMDNICIAKTAEAWAILEAPKKPLATDTDQMELQTDCRMVVEEIKNQGQSFNADSTILHKIKNLLETFHSVNIIHVKRTNNECANMLVRKCLADKTTHFFYHSFPGWLAKFCKADLPFEV
uniref:RNase H type-1 domain-containing protein n=1 Tax=Cannabis sativa TaxID=3483 RepID=A0A803QDV7_CANSA